MDVWLKTEVMAILVIFWPIWSKFRCRGNI